MWMCNMIKKQTVIGIFTLVLLSLSWCLTAVHAQKDRAGKTFYTIANRTMLYLFSLKD